MLLGSGENGMMMFPSISMASLAPVVDLLRSHALLPVLVATGGGPRPIEELGPLLVEIASDIGLIPGSVALAVLSFAVVLLLVRRSRKRRSARAPRQGSAPGGAGRAPGGSVRSTSGPAGRRAGAPPLFAERDEELDQLTRRLRDATDPLAVIEALRSVDAPAVAGPAGRSDEPDRSVPPAPPVLRDEPGSASTIDVPPPPAPAPAPVPAPVRTPVPAPVRTPVQRSLNVRSPEGSPIGWMLAGGATVLVIARLFGGGRGSGRG
jgi:hypothetical protein